jgi:hypothetical protein
MKSYGFEDVILKNPRRAGSLRFDTKEPSSSSREEYFPCKSDRNFVPRHILKINVEKYKALLE